jgi:hypothetical protein
MVRYRSFVKSIPSASSTLELLTPMAFLPLCRNRMTKKTRNWLMVLLSIPVAVILAVTGLLIFNAARPLPPIQPLPNPNGYADLVKAGAMVSDNYDTGDENWNTMKLGELRRLVAKNSDALQAARTNLQEDCAVPLEFSQNWGSRHLPELANFKRLAQAFVAEGRLAEMENRPGDAAKSYLDAIRLGYKSAHGGVLIDQLVGIAIEAMGVSHLQMLVDQLDAKTCREAAATLETLDAQRQTWNEVMQQESAWSRRAYPGLRNRLHAMMTSGLLKPAYQKGEQKFNKRQIMTRQLLVDLAARVYELEHGHRPSSVAELVPDYLKAVPKDPASGANLVLMP